MALVTAQRSVSMGDLRTAVFGYDTPVAEVWPEFAAHGKDSATVRHVLTHSVGVPAVPRDITPEQLCD